MSPPHDPPNGDQPLPADLTQTSTVRRLRPTENAGAARQITDQRTIPRFGPAVILVVCLEFGCLAGRFNHVKDPTWPRAALSALSMLAMVQPSPLALGAAGLAAGLVMESSRASHLVEVPEYEGQDLTLAGKVVGKSPRLHGQNALVVKVTQVLDTDCLPVNFHVQVSVPDTDEIARGCAIVMRAALRRTGITDRSLAVTGSMAKSGWQTGAVPVSVVVEGRGRLGKVLERFTDRPGAGLLAAICLGERWQTDAQVRHILRKTGTYHLLAISGLHAGAAFLPVLFLLRLGSGASKRSSPRKVRAVSLILSVFVLAIYMCFTGLSASGLRAAVFFILAGSAALAGRNPSSLVCLSWCVLLIVCLRGGSQPDLSLVLSALAVTGIILSGREPDGRGIGGFLKASLRVTMGAVFFTLPVATWIAGGISLIAPVGNLVAGMAFALFLIPTAVLMDWAALIPWIPLGPVTGLWLKAAGPVLAFLAHLADLPFSFVRLSATGCMTASAAAVAGILLWRRKRYGLFSGTAIFMVVTVLAAGAQFLGERTSYSDLVISFPEVGQADAAVIRYKGETVLIDCGPPGLPGGDSPLAMALQRMGIRTIDALFLSHMHPDHAGGLRDIMARWPVKRIYIPNNHDARKKLDRYRARGNKASRTESLEHGGEVKTASLVFNILGPDGKKSRPREENRGSLILLLQVDGFQALFTGDAGWDQVLASMAGLHSLDVLKIPHHGSKTGFSPEAMDHAVSAFNDHGPLIAVCPSRPPANRPLPALEVVRWFERSGITLVYTGDNGVNIRYKKSGSKGNGSTVVDKHGLF